MFRGASPLELPCTLARRGPLIPAPLPWLVRCAHSRLHLRRRRGLRQCVSDRVEDLHVAGAAAQVPREPGLDLVVGRRWMALLQRDGRQDHPRRADAALRPAVCDERLLHRVQPRAVRDALRSSSPTCPRTCRTGVRQLLTSSPSTSTAQAPHSPSPQPSLVPVRCSCWRRTSSSARHRMGLDADGLAVQGERDPDKRLRHECRRDVNSQLPTSNSQGTLFEERPFGSWELEVGS